MAALNRINDRLPRFYKNLDRDSLMAILLHAVSEQLNVAETGITDLMQAHWIDTAIGGDLEKLGVLVESSRVPEENDEHLRSRLKGTVDEFKGGGTVSVILRQICELIDAEEKDVEIVENPPGEGSAEFSVKANDSWTLGSNSIKDELPVISLTVEDEGEVSNPQIINTDTEQSITFEGKLKKGEQLVVKQNSVFLDEKDVTNQVSVNEVLQLPRKRCTWKYSEALLEQIATFDGARFDEHIFAVGVPTVKVRFEWKRLQPATFMVQIKHKALLNSGVSEAYLEKAVDSMKAAGVNAIIKIME
jgi:hypothetical protein